VRFPHNGHVGKTVHRLGCTFVTGAISIARLADWHCASVSPGPLRSAGTHNNVSRQVDASTS
jgi:hypothetical protein